jgi:hypothetical protein
LPVSAVDHHPTHGSSEGKSSKNTGAICIMHIERAIELHRKKIEPARARPRGAPEAEVLALERRLDVRFPAAYREYLRWMGNDHEGALQGSDCFIRNVETNAKGLQELLRENGVAHPSCRPIVFFLHQGYIAYWFDAADPREDPEVSCFHENGESREILTMGTFSEWLFEELLGISMCLEGQRTN